jgi:hypothetical protein
LNIREREKEESKEEGQTAARRSLSAGASSSIYLLPLFITIFISAFRALTTKHPSLFTFFFLHHLFRFIVLVVLINFFFLLLSCFAGCTEQGNFAASVSIEYCSCSSAGAARARGRREREEREACHNN